MTAQRSERPWGWFETLTVGEGYLVKQLCIRAGQRISLQLLHCDGAEQAASPGTSLLVPCGAIHRATAGHDDDLLIIEVQRGSRLSEADIERLADDYHRAP